MGLTRCYKTEGFFLHLYKYTRQQPVSAQDNWGWANSGVSTTEKNGSTFFALLVNLNRKICWIKLELFSALTGSFNRICGRFSEG